MYDQQAFEKLKRFLENHPASLEAVSYMKDNFKVGVVINDHNECAYFKKDGQPRFERRRTEDPDMIFYLSPEAVENLVALPHETMAEVAISLSKNYLAGSLKFELTGSVFNLYTRGYLKVLQAASLKSGLLSVSKITQFVSSLKK